MLQFPTSVDRLSMYTLNSPDLIENINLRNFNHFTLLYCQSILKIQPSDILLRTVGENFKTARRMDL